MKYYRKVLHSIQQELAVHKDDIYNYTIPQAWNLYGYAKGKELKHHLYRINPYDYYAYALNQLLNRKQEQVVPMTKTMEKGGAWIKQGVLHMASLRSLTAWDHDRDHMLESDNLYHVNDQGTFVKAMSLLPLYQRIGVNTIVLSGYLSLDKSRGVHDFSDPFSCLSHTQLDQGLYDPIAKGTSIEEQAKAFIELCHKLHIRVMWEICPALCGRNNLYLREHPEWFYWIRKEAEYSYHTPTVIELSNDTIASTKVCPLLYDSEDTKQHIDAFCENPKQLNPGLFQELCEMYDDEHLLQAIETSFQITTAPMISDHINTNAPIDKEVTLLRFYEDRHTSSPLSIKKHPIPFLTQDIVRADVFPARYPQQSLWDTLLQEMADVLNEYQLDGFYLRKPYLLPEKLIKEGNRKLRSIQPHLALLVESGNREDDRKWMKLGFDAVRGNSAYEIYDIWNYRYHNFAYSLHAHPLPCLAASEFYDTPRIVQRDGGRVLARLLMVMNNFLPNAIPTLMAGQLCFEQQPQYLSYSSDQAYVFTLDKLEDRYAKQALVDNYYYQYNIDDFHSFTNMLEIIMKIRTTYQDAICNYEQCQPVWFDTPKDYGIGFTYVLQDKALLVVCNTNVHDDSYLHIHTENMLWNLPFQPTSILQIYSTMDPYVHDVNLDATQSIGMNFAPGEVKFIEISEKTKNTL